MDGNVGRSNTFVWTEICLYFNTFGWPVPNTTPVYKSACRSRSRFTKSVTRIKQFLYFLSTLLLVSAPLPHYSQPAEWPSCCNHYSRDTLGPSPVGWNTSVPRIISLHTSSPISLLNYSSISNSCLSYDHPVVIRMLLSQNMAAAVEIQFNKADIDIHSSTRSMSRGNKQTMVLDTGSFWTPFTRVSQVSRIQIKSRWDLRHFHLHLTTYCICISVC